MTPERMSEHQKEAELGRKAVYELELTDKLFGDLRAGLLERIVSPNPEMALHRDRFIGCVNVLDELRAMLQKTRVAGLNAETFIKSQMEKAYGN